MTRRNKSEGTGERRKTKKILEQDKTIDKTGNTKKKQKKF